MIAIYIDADSCPVKQKIYRVAERHVRKGAALKVFAVSNSPIAVPRDLLSGRPLDAKQETALMAVRLSSAPLGASTLDIMSTLDVSTPLGYRPACANLRYR